MASPEEEFIELQDLLKQRGHSPEEIQKILTRVRDYDQEMQFDSVMDSIGAGRFSLDALIKQALDD